MQLPTLKVIQSGKVLYLTQMTAEQLLSCSYTAEWDPDLGWDIENQGFQRTPVAKHYKAIGKFLADSTVPFIPTAALLSAEESSKGKIPFRASHEDPGFGTLDIQDGRHLLILDYQHRHRGLRYAIENLGAEQLKTFTMPVVIIADIPRYEEILQFYLINNKQRRIDTDLALALVQTLAESGVQEDELANLLGPGKRFRIRATRLTFKLAGRQSGPWAGRILPPHDNPPPGAVIKVKSFVDSLRPVVSPRASISQLEDDELLDVITDYWSALKEILPGAFKNPAQFQMQKTVGVFVFHRLLAQQIYPRCVDAGRPSKQRMRKILEPAANTYMTERFWATRGRASTYVGGSGFNELARLITGRL